MVAVDAKRSGGDENHPRWEVFTHGGRKPTGIDAVEWAKRMADAGAGELLVTSMDRDGTKIGFDNALNRAISEQAGVPLIASGGVGQLAGSGGWRAAGQGRCRTRSPAFSILVNTALKKPKDYMAAAGIEVRQ